MTAVITGGSCADADCRRDAPSADRVPGACGRTSPHAARTGPRDARAAAPPPPCATLANGSDRAPRRVAGAVVAGSVRRYLDAHDGVPARVAGATAPAVRDGQGDGDAADAAPRHATRLCAPPAAIPLGDETGEAARPVGARARSRGNRHVRGGARPPRRASTDSPASMRAAPGGRRASQPTSSSTTRRPSAAARRATDCRDQGNGGARPGRGARRDLRATSRTSAPRRAATSEPGA